MARRILFLTALLLVLAGGYAATPFLAMWQIREAVRSGDVKTLEQKVDWAAVRRSLKQSNGATRAVIAEYSDAANAGGPKPGLWQRIKNAAAPLFTDPLIERYVTAEGASQLYAWRQSWREKVRPTIGLSEPKTVLAETPLAGTGLDRVLSVARRLDRAAFVSPTRIEAELRDRYREDRRWKAVLELQDWTWKLTEVHVLNGPAVRRRSWSPTEVRTPAPEVPRRSVGRHFSGCQRGRLGRTSIF